MAHTSRPFQRLCLAFNQFRSYSAPADRSIPAAKQKYVPTSGTYPKGFLAGTSHAGVKASNTKYDDIALLVSEQPCTAAAVFTRNVFKAAPVIISKSILASRKDGFRGIVVNSGCANAVTGSEGNKNANQMALTVDQCLDPATTTITPKSEWKRDAPPQTLVMSTGVIGQQLPMDRITDAIPRAHAALGSSHEHFLAAAQAICTTDTFPKLISRTFTLPSDPNTTYSIAGMAKGAGMIHPNMGTLLSMIFTDAKIEQSSLRGFLTSATNLSFNCISVDGDMSTNDTVALLANGAAAPEDAPSIKFGKFIDGAESDEAIEDSRVFSLTLRKLMRDLAKLCVRDGEGATKFVTIRVQSTHSLLLAHRVASSIATSALVKTALYGKDANWGRILCAIGYTPGVMEERATYRKELQGTVRSKRTSVAFVPADGSEELAVFTRGEAQVVDEQRAKEILEMEDIEILVKLDDAPSGDNKLEEQGEKKVWQAKFWTCDFSHEYVTINGDYRT